MVITTPCQFLSYMVTFTNISLPTSCFRFLGGFDQTSFTLHCPFFLPYPPGKQKCLGFPQYNSHLLQFVHFLFSSWPHSPSLCNLQSDGITLPPGLAKKSFLCEDFLCLFNLWLVWPLTIPNLWACMAQLSIWESHCPSLGLIEIVRKNPGITQHHFLKI